MVKQFERPSANLDRHGKSWQTVPASTLQTGDIVEGFGCIEDLKTTDAHVQLTNRVGDVRWFHLGDPLKAFTKILKHEDSGRS